MDYIIMSMMKSKRSKGFTLVEMLVCLLTVTLLTSLLLVVTDFARQTYMETETNAQGQVLCSILINTIQDELRFSRTPNIYTNTKKSINVLNEDAGNVNSFHNCYQFSYYSDSLGLGGDCAIVNYNGRVYIVPEYTSAGTINDATEKFMITGESTYTYNMSAYATPYFCPDLNLYYVNIIVKNSKGENIIEENFVVNRLRNNDYS